MGVANKRWAREALGEVLRSVEPVAAVYLGVPPGEVPAHRADWGVRWRPLAEALRESGVEQTLIDALQNAAATLAAASRGRPLSAAALFGADGRVLAAFPTPGATWKDQAWVTSPAHVLPLLEWAHQHPAYVVVAIDRSGAEIESCAGAGAAPVHTTVEGPDDEIERNSPGGYMGLAQPRYQHRAEDSWQHNAGAVAEAMTEAVDRVGARLVVVTGDVRAIQLLRRQLPDRILQTVNLIQIRGSRSQDGSQESRGAIVAEVARGSVVREAEELLSTFVEGRALNGASVEGETATLDALAEGRVGTLLVTPHLDRARAAWLGADPKQVRTGDLPEPEWSEIRRGPLVDVAVRSAVLTGADVQVVPDDPAGPAEGLGALCRFK